MSVYTLPKHLDSDFSIPNRKPIRATVKDEESSIKGLVSFGVLSEFGQDIFRDSADTTNEFTEIGSTNWDTVEGERCLDVNQDSSGSERVQSNKASLSATGDWTVNQKLYRRFGTTNDIFLGQYSGGQAGRFYVEIVNGGNFTVFDGSSFHTITIDEPPFGEWMQVAVSRKGGVFSAVVNGVASTSNPSSGASLYQGIGTGYGGTNINSMRGWISNFQTFNRALTLAEIRLLQRDNYTTLRPEVLPSYFTSSDTGETVDLVGQQSSSAQGSVTATGQALEALSGQTSTAGQGALSVQIPITQSLTGQESTLGQGVVTATGVSIATLTGQGSSSAQGSITVDTSITTALGGQASTAGQGSITATVGAGAELTGQELTTSQGSIVISGASSLTLAGQALVAAQGALTIATGSSFSLTGQESTSAQGAITTIINTVVALTGQGTTADQGTIGLQTANILTLVGQESSVGQGVLTVSGGGWTTQPDDSAIWSEQTNDSTTWTIQ